MSKLLTEQDFDQAAKTLRSSAAAIKSVSEAEMRGNGFYESTSTLPPVTTLNTLNNPQTTAAGAANRTNETPPHSGGGLAQTSGKRDLDEVSGAVESGDAETNTAQNQPAPAPDSTQARETTAIATTAQTEGDSW